MFPNNKPASNVTNLDQIFISYVREDKEEVDKIYQLIKEMGYEPWMDTVDIPGGTEWEALIFDIMK